MRLSRLAPNARGELTQADSWMDDVVRLYNKGKLNDADKLITKVLDIRNRILGDIRPEVADTLNNMVGLYRAMGNNEKAWPLCKQALEIQRTTRGATHPSYADSLGDLASLYQDAGEYAKAEPLFREVVEIQKRGAAKDIQNMPGP